MHTQSTMNKPTYWPNFPVIDTEFDDYHQDNSDILLGLHQAQFESMSKHVFCNAE